jgi:hypothetical protein
MTMSRKNILNVTIVLMVLGAALIEPWLAIVVGVALFIACEIWERLAVRPTRLHMR